MNTRKATLAGSWYPGSAHACRKQIEGFLEEPFQAPPAGIPIGAIAPHAGWAFSGAVACRVIQQLDDGRPIDLIIVSGMHLHDRSPAYLMATGTWETPLGSLQIATRIAQPLSRQFDFEIETPQRFVQDNTIELQLPFIKYFYPNAQILPMGLPPTPLAAEIASAAVKLAVDAGMHVKILGSTDLTHYGANYGFSPKGRGPQALEWVKTSNDRRMVEAMLAMSPSRVLDEARQSQNACCAGAVAGAIAGASALGANTAALIDYRTSHDRHPSDSFVGYAGVVFVQTD